MARDTWPAEIEKWDHLKGLTYSVATGSEKERKAALMQKADIYIINRENVDWLVNRSGLPFDYDMMVVDELSSFKSHRAKRFKSLMKVRPKVKRIVGLTGTPSACLLYTSIHSPGGLQLRHCVKASRLFRCGTGSCFGQGI